MPFGISRSTRAESADSLKATLELTSLQLGNPPGFTRFQNATTLASPSPEFLDSLIGMHFGFAGKPVTPETALRVAAFLSAVKMLAADIAKLPLVTRETGVVNGRQRTNPALKHPLYPLFMHVPNRWQTSYQLRFFLVAQLLMSGNCYCQKITNQAGDVIELIPLNAWAMQCRMDENPPLVSPSGNPTGTQFDKSRGANMPVPVWHYENDRNHRKFYQADLWHVALNNFGHIGIGIQGEAMIALGKEAISVLIAAEEYAGRNFANGLGMGGFISLPADSDVEVDEEEGQNIVDRLKKDFAGSQNAGKFTILPGGATFQKMQFNPQESQLLESRKWNEQTIARMLGGAPLAVKLDLSEKNSTYASSAAFLDEYWNTSLLPICTAFEQTIIRDLIPRSQWGTISVKHNADIVLRGSPSERAKTNAEKIASFQMTPNEARLIEDLDTIEGADFLSGGTGTPVIFDLESQEFFIPGQKVPEKEEASDELDDEEVDGAPDAEGEDEGQAAPPAPVPKPDKVKNRLALLANTAVERVMRKEAKGGIDSKFLIEVLMISPEQAEAYIAGRGKLNDTEARAALVALAQGE